MLKDKVVVVTGGAGLIGKEFVKAIVKNSAIAIIADINIQTAEQVAHQLSNELKSENIDFCELNIISKDSINECIKKVTQKYGKIDAVINSAYPRTKNYGRHFFDVEYEDFTEILNLNLGGYFLVSQQFAKFFSLQGYGNIINISSIYGVVAPRFEIYEGTQMTTPIEYAAIKSALLHITKYMAKYFKGLNIRVNCITPGGILDAQPQSFLDNYKSFCSSKGMLDAQDLCGALVFLLSDESRFVNGQNIIVDDGFSL
ncbi:oxidoreductase [Campylobacter suis]|uniref:Sulfoquinovose 1-dehydrogenase n=1 Tax=Campylobacter suis TaxID=2790657 RepID=A0ABN7K871_9BACT|nr:oxidoreductase [Campylobacter suis]CAD7288726.1 Sulfoquinovose 1-dehydrogenase [Campylobacter suis]